MIMYLLSNLIVNENMLSEEVCVAEYARIRKNVELNLEKLLTKI